MQKYSVSFICPNFVKGIEIDKAIGVHDEKFTQSQIDLDILYSRTFSIGLKPTRFHLF